MRYSGQEFHGLYTPIVKMKKPAPGGFFHLSDMCQKRLQAQKQDLT